MKYSSDVPLGLTYCTASHFARKIAYLPLMMFADTMIYAPFEMVELHYYVVITKCTNILLTSTTFICSADYW